MASKHGVQKDPTSDGAWTWTCAGCEEQGPTLPTRTAARDSYREHKAGTCPSAKPTKKAAKKAAKPKTTKAGKKGRRSKKTKKAAAKPTGETVAWILPQYSEPTLTHQVAEDGKTLCGREIPDADTRKGDLLEEGRKPCSACARKAAAAETAMS